MSAQGFGQGEAGYLLLTFYLPRRRWYGKLKSQYTLEARMPQGKSVEISWQLFSGWMKPQYQFQEYRIPTNIIQLSDAS